jgi:hypothetical protein
VFAPLSAASDFPRTRRFFISAAKNFNVSSASNPKVPALRTVTTVLYNVAVGTRYRRGGE